MYRGQMSLPTPMTWPLLRFLEVFFPIPFPLPLFLPELLTLVTPFHNFSAGTKNPNEVIYIKICHRKKENDCLHFAKKLVCRTGKAAAKGCTVAVFGKDDLLTAKQGNSGRVETAANLEQCRTQDNNNGDELKIKRFDELHINAIF